MQFDPATYRHHLDAFDMSEDAKLACMQTIWAYLEGELDRQAGCSPEQILLGIREQTNARIAVNPVDLPGSLNHTFNDAAAGNASGKRCP